MMSFRSLVGDALKFHDTAHGALKAAVRLTGDDWSPEARAAAAEARKKTMYARKSYTTKEHEPDHFENAGKNRSYHMEQTSSHGPFSDKNNAYSYAKGLGLGKRSVKSRTGAFLVEES